MSSLSLELQALRESHETLTDLGKHIAAGRWLNACAITILCYDTFLTLSDEVELLWPKKWSLIKVFTHLVRRGPLTQSQSTSLFPFLCVITPRCYFLDDKIVRPLSVNTGASLQGHGFSNLPATPLISLKL
ncbi:hypothetical protein FRC18_001074 [Serendipita sp. 400]|nr:hypothetical protein FRC18_001074 [Serendipita sp. 400]